MSAVLSSKLTEQDWRYPQSEPRQTGFLALQEDSAHVMYWEEYGNPNGEPVLVVHGGPGGASSPFMAHYFDPQRYRVILYDQRGCGKSTPSVAQNPADGLTDNTTAHLIEDIDRLRNHLGITGKTHLFGGSWGSTLSLAYAIAHPENVESLILRGIFLCRREDLDYLYQGNAADYEANPFDTRFSGAYHFYPEAWKDFVEIIPPEKRHDMVAAYAKIFGTQPQTQEQADFLTRAACAWSVWEGVTSYLAQDLSDLGKFADPEFARAFALIENHYFMNGAFLGGKSGEGNRDNNFILENAARLKDIPVHIVHGRFDVVCPALQSDALVAALKDAGNENVTLTRTVAGHSMQERQNALALTDIMDGLGRGAPQPSIAENTTPGTPFPG